MAALTLIAATLMCGCDDSNRVTGRVTLDSEPVPEAIVQFTPQDSGGRIALGRTDANGNYRLKSSRNISDVSPGKYRVAITTSDLIAGDDSEGERMSPEKVPPQFNKDSELIREIKEGSNEINFELTGK